MTYFRTKRKSFGRKLVGYAESIRGSIPSISRPLKGAKFSKLGLQDMKETEDIEKDMKRRFIIILVCTVLLH